MSMEFDLWCLVEGGSHIHGFEYASRTEVFKGPNRETVLKRARVFWDRWPGSTFVGRLKGPGLTNGPFYPVRIVNGVKVHNVDTGLITGEDLKIVSNSGEGRPEHMYLVDFVDYNASSKITPIEQETIWDTHKQLREKYADEYQCENWLHSTLDGVLYYIERVLRRHPDINPSMAIWRWDASKLTCDSYVTFAGRDEIAYLLKNPSAPVDWPNHSGQSTGIGLTHKDNL